MKVEKLVVSLVDKTVALLVVNLVESWVDE